MSKPAFTDFEKETLYGFFDELQNHMASAVCNDVFYPKDWTKEQKNDFCKTVFESIGEEFDEGDYVTDFMVLDYLVNKLKPFVEGTEE